MTYFSPDSFANTPMPAARVVDSISENVVNKLNAWVHQKSQPTGPAPTGGKAPTFTAQQPWLNTDVAIYAADHAHERPVTLKSSWPQLQAVLQPLLLEVPVPDVAIGGPDSDKSAVIVDDLNDKVYEFWGFQRAQTTLDCSAIGGGVIKDASRKAGNYSDMSHPPESMVYLGSQWGVRASGFSFLAGMITCDEWKARSIPHAVAMQVPWAHLNWFSSPAQRTDPVGDQNYDAIPYGARFMLPASFDMDGYQALRQKTDPAYRLWSQDRAICKAWMNYGLFAVDQTGSGVGLVAENVRGWRARNNTTEDPYANWDRKAMMLRLPWERLQMMTLDSRRRP